MANVYVPPRPVRRLVEAGLCRYCDTVAWLADDNGPLHLCCEMWASDLVAGKPCPSCSESRSVRRRGRS